MKNYFEVEKSEEETPHRIHINCGENARVVLIETAEGFIVDVYRNTDDELLDSMTVWNDDIFDNGRDFTDDLSEDEQPDACKTKLTKLIEAEDVEEVAKRLKMKISGERVFEILQEYDDYRKQFPNDNWSEIVEQMLYNFQPKIPTAEEIAEFKRYWGQTHKEICDALGYDEDCSEILIDDYFWIEADGMWYNKSASIFTDRDQEIANYLMENS